MRYTLLRMSIRYRRGIILMNDRIMFTNNKKATSSSLRQYGIKNKAAINLQCNLIVKLYSCLAQLHKIVLFEEIANKKEAVINRVEFIFLLSEFLTK